MSESLRVGVPWLKFSSTKVSLNKMALGKEFLAIVFLVKVPLATVPLDKKADSAIIGLNRKKPRPWKAVIARGITR